MTLNGHGIHHLSKTIKFFVAIAIRGRQISCGFVAVDFNLGDLIDA